MSSKNPIQPNNEDKNAEKRFISMLTDFGFKATFGNQNNTTFLRKAIQLLIKSPVPIKRIRFNRNEFSAITKEARSGLFDITCTDEKNNAYIVEMQLLDYKHFIHRSKFYAFHRLNTLVKRGRYRFDDLNRIYAIAILAGSTFHSSKEFHHIGCIKNQHGELMDEQITHIMVELGKWKKTAKEVETDLEKLLFIMKYTHAATKKDTLPPFVNEKWIATAIKELELKNLSPEEAMAYEMELARLGSIKTAWEEKSRETKRAKKEAQKAKKEAQQAERKAQQAERERQQAERERQQAERERQQAERERQQAERERQQAEKKAQQAEKQLEKQLREGIVNLLKMQTLSVEKIANLLNTDIKTVQAIQKQLNQ